MKKWLIAAGVVIIVALFLVLNLRRQGGKVEVNTTEVKRRTITKYVTASGQIKPTRQVEVSASAIGKVTKLAVSEGDRVEKGDFLLQIDPTPYATMVDQLRASIGSAKATLEMEEAALVKARSDLERAKTLHATEAVSDEELRVAQLNADVGEAKVKSARQQLAQYEANLKKATHDLNEVRITAEISGVVTELNVEEGESAIMGTLNNPGTVLLTVADLSEIEAEVEVDETEVVFVKLGQEADINLDAYPDTTFKGVVTEVGNSALRQQIALGQSSVDFKVKIKVQDEIPQVRPGLSASAKIKVAEEEAALSIPIQCLTVRRQSELEAAAGDRPRGRSKEKEEAEKEEDEGKGDDETGDRKEDVEGVFVVVEGKAQYRPVKVGIAGSSYFEVKEGLSEGEVVVSGPFKAINELRNGDLVKMPEKAKENQEGEEKKEEKAASTS